MVTIRVFSTPYSALTLILFPPAKSIRASCAKRSKALWDLFKRLNQTYIPHSPRRPLPFPIPNLTENPLLGLSASVVGLLTVLTVLTYSTVVLYRTFLSSGRKRCQEGEGQMGREKKQHGQSSWLIPHSFFSSPIFFVTPLSPPLPRISSHYFCRSPYHTVANHRTNSPLPCGGAKEGLHRSHPKHPKHPNSFPIIRRTSN
jgi:hypothetical protein